MIEGRKQRSLFWPIMLIGVGVLLLMQNLGLVGELNWLLLARLWPVLLIAAGIDVLLRDAPWVGSVMGAVLAVGVIAFIYSAPALNLGFTTTLPDLQQERFVEALDGAESAAVKLNIDRGQVNVFALGDSANLIEVDALHRDSASLSSNGGRTPSVEFRMESINLAFPMFFFGGDENEVEIGLNAGLPIALEVDHGSGNAEMDLSALDILELEVDNGSGRIDVMLPAALTAINLSSGSGSLSVTGASGSELDLKAGVGSGRIAVQLGADTAGSLDLEAGSGSITVTLPEGVGVQLSGSTGSGNVRVPDAFVKISGDDPNEGTWQTPGFEDAAVQLFIRFHIGSGTLRIEY